MGRLWRRASKRITHVIGDLVSMGDFRKHLTSVNSFWYPREEGCTWFISARKADIINYEIPAGAVDDAYIPMFLKDDAKLDAHLKDGALVIIYSITKARLAEQLKVLSATPLIFVAVDPDAGGTSKTAIVSSILLPPNATAKKE